MKAYQNASKLKDTAQMNLYSVDYSIWKDTMVTYYQRANAVLGDLGSDTITEHEYVQEDVAVITYSSGAKVAGQLYRSGGCHRRPNGSCQRFSAFELKGERA